MTQLLLPSLSTSVDVKPCCIAGCNAPRLKNKHGVPYSRCDQHQHEYWHDAAMKRRGGTPPRRAARNAGQRGRKQQEAPAPVKLMLIDYDRGVVQLLQLVIVNEVPMANLRRGTPNPNTVGFYEHLGYRIVEIRPPQIAPVKA